MDKEEERKKEWHVINQIGRILMEEANRNKVLRVLDRPERLLRKHHGNVPF